MGKITIPDTTETFCYEPDELLCMQAAHKRTIVFHIDTTSPQGFNTKVPCGNLKVFEDKVKDYPCFMRVHDKWVVNLKHVRSYTRNNIIKLKVNCCKQDIDLDPNLRQMFKERLRSVG